MKLPEGVENKYAFTLILAKRARQILKGASPLVKTNYRNPIKIAEKELLEGLIKAEFIKINPSEDFAVYK